MSGYNNNNQYSSYGGNPYGSEGDAQPAGYGSGGGYGSNPYGNENPYGADYAQQQPSSRLDAPVLPHQQSNYSQQTQESSYSQHASGAPVSAAVNAPPPVAQGRVEYVQPSHNTLSNPDFLSRVEAVKADIRTLTTHGAQHQHQGPDQIPRDRRRAQPGQHGQGHADQTAEDQFHEATARVQNGRGQLREAVSRADCATVQDCKPRGHRL
jgi:hypothetical protein